MAANESSWPEALAVNREPGPWCPIAYPLGSAGRDTSLLRKRVQIGAKRDTNLLREDTEQDRRGGAGGLQWLLREAAEIRVICMHRIMKRL